MKQPLEDTLLPVVSPTVTPKEQCFSKRFHVSEGGVAEHAEMLFITVRPCGQLNMNPCIHSSALNVQEAVFWGQLRQEFCHL